MPARPPGSDLDLNGCMASAGYIWCEILGKCIRSWVTACEYPENCLGWYDGCNTCNIIDGKLGACTEMMCFQRGIPECSVWSPGTISTMPVINPFLASQGDGH